MSNGFTISGICAQYKQQTNSGSLDMGATATLDNTTNGLYKEKVVVAGNTTVSYYAFSVHSASAAQNTIQTIDKILNIVDSKRAELGALQNRMESTIRNQENVAENVSDARSRIRDTDYSEEASNLSAQQIIQQAAQSVLTQANQRPQIAMNLLGN